MHSFQVSELTVNVHSTARNGAQTYFGENNEKIPLNYMFFELSKTNDFSVSFYQLATLTCDDKLRDEILIYNICFTFYRYFSGWVIFRATECIKALMENHLLRINDCPLKLCIKKRLNLY